MPVQNRSNTRRIKIYIYKQISLVSKLYPHKLCTKMYGKVVAKKNLRQNYNMLSQRNITIQYNMHVHNRSSTWKKKLYNNDK